MSADRRARDLGRALASAIRWRLAQSQDALILQGGDGADHLVLRLRNAVRWHAFQATPASPGVTFETVDCDAVGHRPRWEILWPADTPMWRAWQSHSTR